MMDTEAFYCCGTDFLMYMSVIKINITISPFMFSSAVFKGVDQ
jgi:hypothetical protein